MLLLALGGVHQGLVIVQDRFRKARGPRREIDRRVVLVRDQDPRIPARAVAGEPGVILGKARAGIPVEEQQALVGNTVRDLLHAADELLSEDQDVALREIHAVLDLLRGIAEIQRDRQRAGLQGPEIDRQPLQAVHQEDPDLVALLDAALQQQIRETVRLLVEDPPGDLSAVGAVRRGFHEAVLSPGHSPVVFDRGIHLDESDVLRIQFAVLFQ